MARKVCKITLDYEDGGRTFLQGEDAHTFLDSVCSAFNLGAIRAGSRFKNPLQNIVWKIEREPVTDPTNGNEEQ
jgi:hypothetical protein